jgi:hypothetical protein
VSLLLSLLRLIRFDACQTDGGQVRDAVELATVQLLEAAARLGDGWRLVRFD